MNQKLWLTNPEFVLLFDEYDIDYTDLDTQTSSRYGNDLLYVCSK